MNHKKEEVILLDAEGNPYNFGVHVHGYGKEVVKGMNLQFKTYELDGKSMKTIEFKDAEKVKFDSLYDTVMPLAAKASYDQGYKLYNSRKYQDSLKKLQKVQVYYPQYYRMDATLYYMGRCCQALQDSRSAVALFQKLMNEYPASTYAKSAKVRINELTKIP